MMNNKNCMTTIKLKTLKSLILFPENSNLYFSRHKDYHTMSSISKAAYESALKDSVNDYM